MPGARIDVRQLETSRAIDAPVEIRLSGSDLQALRALAASGGEWFSADRDALVRKAQDGEIVVIDVRPANEFEQAHFPYARSMPLAQLRARLAELPRDKPSVAYCRGPYCLMSADAVRLLQDQGFSAQQWREGVADWGLVRVG